MLDFVPVPLGTALVLEVRQNHVHSLPCEGCVTRSAALHNWTFQVGLPYWIFDWQDHPQVCISFLHEISHLHKRLPIPVLFSGIVPSVHRVMEQHLKEIGYSWYGTPEMALSYLEEQHPGLVQEPLQAKICWRESFMSSLQEDLTLKPAFTLVA